MTMRLWQLLYAAVLAAVVTATTVQSSAAGGAPLCDDFNVCTNPDMCADGTCSGSPISGDTCDDGNACTKNDTCASGVCQGTPDIGAVCGQEGCEGACSAQGFCLPDPEKQLEPCTDGFGPCTNDDACLGTVCIGSFLQCPDSDGNKCTLDFCNVATGTCQNIGQLPCGDCAACDAETGSCAPANQGNSCNDFNECTGDGTCTDGECAAGLPTGTAEATATATLTPTGLPTGTATATATATDIIILLPTDTATPVDTSTPTETPTGVPTGTATATATFTATGIPTGTATATATETPSGIPTGTATATVTPTGLPTGTATATVTATPTSNTPTATRTNTSTVAPLTSTPTATATSLPVVASILVGSATGEADSTVTVEVKLETTIVSTCSDTGAACTVNADCPSPLPPPAPQAFCKGVAGTQNDITFDVDAAIPPNAEGKPDCEVNPDIGKGDTSFAYYQPSGCTPGATCTGVRALVLAVDNLDPIPSGSVLYTCKIALAADAAGSYPLTCSNPGAGDSEPRRLGVDCTSGTITAGVVPTETATGTETPTVSPTPTPSATPSAATPTTPTATGTPTATATGTPTATRTRKPKRDEDDGCAVVAPRDANAAFALLLPVAAMVLLRRRRR